MSAPRIRPRPPRIAASLYERRNDFRPPAPLTERLLHTLGAHPSFADAVLGDLAEERARRQAEQGWIRARLWYVREALCAVPHLLGNAVRHGGAAGRARAAAWLAGAALVPAMMAAVALRPSPPAFLVFEGQRGGDAANVVILNTTHPVQLVTHVFDARRRPLAPTSLRYEWAAGVPISVTPTGVVTCTESGEAELRATAGRVATTVLVRCRPVNRVTGAMALSLVAGERAQALPFTAYAPNGRTEYLVAYEARVADTNVAVLDGLQIRPRAPGRTTVVVKVGDGQATIAVNVYELVPTLAAVQPDQRLVTTPVDLAAGDTIDWPLPAGSFWLRFTSSAPWLPVPRIKVSGNVSCEPAFGATNQASCLVQAPGARIRITHPGTSREAIAGRLALERRDP